MLDRKKDMINRGGYKVYSAQVESALAAHPDVLEAAVFGQADPVSARGEVIAADRGPNSAAAANRSARRPNHIAPNTPTTATPVDNQDMSVERCCAHDLSLRFGARLLRSPIERLQNPWSRLR